MRILAHNLLKDAQTITMSNLDSNYKVEDLYSNILEEIVYASVSNTLITAIFDEDQSIDTFCFGYHNAHTAIFTFKDIAGTIIESINISFPLLNQKYYLSSMLNGVRSVEIVLSSSDTLFIGNISFGLFTQLYNVIKPYEIEHVDSSEFDITDGAHVLDYEGVIVKAFSIRLDKLNYSEADSIKEAHASVKSGKTFWLDRHEDRQTEPIFGCFVSNLRESEVYDKTVLTIDFREAR